MFGINCYRNIYQAVLKWIPLDFHPVLRLVNKKWNSVVKNKYCRINYLMSDAKIELLEFVLTQPNVIKFKHPDTKNTSPYSILSFCSASLSGRVDIMTWLKANSCQWNCLVREHKYFNSVASAIADSPVISFKWFLDHALTGYHWRGGKYANEELQDKIIHLVCQIGDKAKISLLRSIEAGFCVRDYVTIIESGHLEVIELFHPKNLTGNKTQCMLKAFESGNLEVIKYIHSLRGIISSDCIIPAIRTNNLQILDYLYQHSPFDKFDWSEFPPDVTAQTFYWLFNKSIILTAETFNCIMSSPDWEELFEYLRQRGCLWDDGLYISVLKHNCRPIEMFKFLHDHGCPYELNLIKAVVERGQLQCLEYCVKNMFGVDKLSDNIKSDLVGIAVTNGRLDCLKYLFGLGCQGDTDLVKVALSKQNVAVCQLLLKQGYTLPWCALSSAVTSGRLENVQFVLSLIDKPPNCVYVWRTTIRIANLLKSSGVILLGYEDLLSTRKLWPIDDK